MSLSRKTFVDHTTFLNFLNHVLLFEVLEFHGFGDSFGVLLGGSQASPGPPELPQKFPGDFPGTSLAVDFKSNPEVPRKFPDFPRISTDFNPSLSEKPDILC